MLELECLRCIKPDQLVACQGAAISVLQCSIISPGSLPVAPLGSEVVSARDERMNLCNVIDTSSILALDWCKWSHPLKHRIVEPCVQLKCCYRKPMCFFSLHCTTYTDLYLPGLTRVCAVEQQISSQQQEGGKLNHHAQQCNLYKLLFLSFHRHGQRHRVWVAFTSLSGRRAEHNFYFVLSVLSC